MQAHALIAVLSVVLQSFALREIAQEESVTLPAFTTDAATDSTIEETSKLILQGLENRSATKPVILGQVTRAGTSSSKGTATASKKYIHNQFKLRHSAYHMPTKHDDQDKWETRFKKIAELPVEAILFMFTGHLDNTHRPTYGWQEELKKLQESRTAVTLEPFFSHVRQQLFPAPTSRHQAYEELLKVHEAIKSGKFQDCLAFSTYLKTLWLLLFPQEGSNERQPIQQYEACIKLHSIMSRMFDLPFSIRESNFFVHA
jgi:hypothetical protein